jgi:hypothetical protein
VRWIAIVVVAAAASPAWADEDPPAPVEEETPPKDTLPPRVVALAPEPVSEPWSIDTSARAKERAQRGVFGELFVEASPLGMGVGGEGTRYLALARVGLGFAAVTSREVLKQAFYAYAAYEISPLSRATLGLHLRYLGGGPPAWGLGVGALVDIDQRVGGAVSLRFAILGFEVQVRDAEAGLTGAAFLTLEVPVFFVRRAVKR